MQVCTLGSLRIKTKTLNTEEDEEKMIREENDFGWIIFVYVKRLKGRIKTGKEWAWLPIKQSDKIHMAAYQANKQEDLLITVFASNHL